MFRKLVLLLLVLILTACNFPTRQTPRLEETLQAGIVQTAAALTALAPPATPIPPAAVPQVQQPLPELPVPVVQAPGAPLSQGQPVVYSAPILQTGLPVVTVSVNTNCRSGPARKYTLLGWLLVGEQAVVVGQNQQFNYWIIQNPRGSGTCWLWGQYATVFGDISQVPHVDFPIATPPVPVTGPAYLNALVPTNCYTGAGTQFPVLGILQAGQLAPILGRDPSSVWWLIQHPSSIGQCWVWGGVQITGNVAAIPVVPVTGPTPIPPIPTPPPAAAHYLAVSVNTNCRTGPSPQFPIVSYLLVGQYAPVVGRTPDATWWLIQNPNQSGVICWVWGKYATLWGDFGSIPVIPPTGVTPVPPTLTPTPTVPTPVTPVPGQPFLMTSVNTNCRTGPSPRHPIVGTLLVGQQASIYGRNLLGDWWYVQLPTFPEVHCWIWGQYAAVYGDTSQVPILPVVGFGLTPGVQEVDPVFPGDIPFVPPTPFPAATQPPPIDLSNPFDRLFNWFRGQDTADTWEPTLAPPRILIQPLEPIQQTPLPPLIQPVQPTPIPPLIQPVQPTPLPPLILPVQPTPLPPLIQPVQPTPIPPLIQPVQPTPVPPLIQPLQPTPEPIISTPIPPALVQPPAAAGADECIVLDQTVGFGQIFSPNTPIEVRWTVLNTSSTTWNPGDVSARYLSGDVVHTTAEVPLPQAVPPGGTINISVPAAAPAAAQSYSSLWGVTRGADVLCNLVIVIEVE